MCVSRVGYEVPSVGEVYAGCLCAELLGGLSEMGDPVLLCGCESRFAAVDVL